MFATFVLGGLFLGIELWEFTKLVAEGNSWQASGFLTSYFTLVGTHGLHIAIGLLWLVVLAFALRSRGITNTFTRRLTLFSLFWHFLDIIWICIFTLVYLMGAV
jgi:cytochrome o ubiquinol oxidase subunit 3